MFVEFVKYVNRNFKTLDLLANLEIKLKILKDLEEDLFNQWNITLTLGAELEFYLSEEITIERLNFIFERLLREYNVIFEKEEGTKQYEIKFPIVNNSCILANNLTYIKKMMVDELKIHDINILFLAKPYIDQPGSALHIHFSLWNGIDNLFKKSSSMESDIMLNVIGGICKTMKETSILFAPSENCYKRYIKDCNAPTTISWGGNNRTVALRIPSSASGDRRVEYRVASATSDVYLVLISILIGIIYGIKNKVVAPKRIYGNAAHEQYNLEKLPQTLYEATKLFKNSKIIKPWIKKLI